MPLGSITEALPATPAEPGPGPEVWARYVELLPINSPTAGQQREFTAVAKKLGIAQQLADFHRIVLTAAALREGLLRAEDESEARAEEVAANQAEAAARRALMDEIYKLRWKLDGNDFPEAQRYAAARDRCGRLATAVAELAAIYSCFPELLAGGLPPAHEGPWAGLPPEILNAATKKKLFHLLTHRPAPQVSEI